MQIYLNNKIIIRISISQNPRHICMPHFHISSSLSSHSTHISQGSLHASLVNLKVLAQQKLLLLYYFIGLRREGGKVQLEIGLAWLWVWFRLCQRWRKFPLLFIWHSTDVGLLGRHTVQKKNKKKIKKRKSRGKNKMAAS